jgi:hypothetical protein
MSENSKFNMNHLEGVKKSYCGESKFLDSSFTLLKCQKDPFIKRKIICSSLLKVVTAIGFLSCGTLAYFVPGVGWIVGAALTNAGIQGLFARNLNWEEFAFRVGLGAIIGAATSVVGTSLDISGLFLESSVQQIFKKAVYSACCDFIEQSVEAVFD